MLFNLICLSIFNARCCLSPLVFRRKYINSLCANIYKCYHPEQRQMLMVLGIKVRPYRASNDHLTICWNDTTSAPYWRFCQSTLSELALNGAWWSHTYRSLLSWVTQFVMFVWDAYVMCHFPTEQQLEHHPDCWDCQQYVQAYMLWMAWTTSKLHFTTFFFV